MLASTRGASASLTLLLALFVVSGAFRRLDPRHVRRRVGGP